MLRNYVAGLCSLSLLLGCERQRSAATPAVAPPKPALKPAPATPLAKKADALGQTVAWTPEWDAYVEQQLPADLLATDVAPAVRSVCPEFAAMTETDRRVFWAYTFQAIAAAEAGLKPTADVRHREAAVDVRDTTTHRLSRQEGLMQVKYQDADRYGCDFDPKADARLPEKSPERTILQPQRNLSCGIKIMEEQIVTRGKPLVERSSYWATLQPGTLGHGVFLRQMKDVPAACRSPRERARAEEPGQRVAASE